MNQARRYDVSSALQHPFITRQLDAVVPLEQNEVLTKVENE